MLRRLASRSVTGAATLVISLAACTAPAPASAAGRHHTRHAGHVRRTRAHLLREVRKNPRVVLRRSFLHRAELVHFTLPVTIRLRGSNNSTPASPVYDDVNPNSVSIDLGTSLGNRQVSIGGTLPAEIVFTDQFDGGAAGNVLINLPGSSASGGLTTTSIPLLWNNNVSTAAADRQWWGIAFDGGGINPQTGTNTGGEYDDGCGGFRGGADLPTAITQIGHDAGVSELDHDGIPYFAPTANPPSEADPEGTSGHAIAFRTAMDAGAYDAAAMHVAGFIPVIPGVDSVSALRVSGETTPFTQGTDAIDNMGLNPDPFPVADDGMDPLGGEAAPNVYDTVLRTAPIRLRVAAPGTEVQQTDDSLGVDGSQNIIIGKSGGQANLFGNIPGKDHSIDVTVSLEGKINTIMRLIDEEYSPALAGGEAPPAALECRQVFTGAVQNYVPGIRLTGDVTMSPGITPDGFERIATAALRGEDSSQFAVAACLYPFATFAAEANGADTAAPPVPTPGFEASSRNPVPVSASCGTPATAAIRALGLGTRNLTDLAAADEAGTTAADGSRLSLAAMLNVTSLSADILIGKNQG